MKRDFEFEGSGFGYLWLCIWTTVLSVITFGLFFPWAYSAQQRWICSNTYVNGRQLRFDGTGFGFFFQWLIIMVLTTITFGIYIPCGVTASLNAGKPATPSLPTNTKTKNIRLCG